MTKGPIDISKKNCQIIKTNRANVDFLLSLNVNNRNVKRKHKDWLKAAVKENNFLLSNQGVGVSSDGVLIDGQHRLTAIREAGYPPVELVVVTGLAPELRLYLDQNAKRSTADALKIVLNHTVTSRQVSAVTFLMKLEMSEDGEFVYKKEKLALEAVKKKVIQHEAFVEKIQSAIGTIGRAAIIAGIMDFGLRYDRDTALDFALQVGKGENLTARDPAYKLRDMLYKQRGNGVARGGGLPQLIDYRQTIFCCMAFAADKKIEAVEQASNWDALPLKRKKAA